MNHFAKSTRFILPVFAFLALSFMLSCKKDKDESVYLPESGHLCISFTHRFNVADYEEGKRIVVENFSTAIDNSGQTRRTYFMSNPDSAEVYVISFFHPNSSTTEWLNSDERDAVLQQLKPLYREPLDVQEYTTDLIHNTHFADAENTPGYLPEPGDEVLVFSAFFNAQDYDNAVNVITTDFPKVIENSGQKRRTYNVLNPGDSEAVVVSFFHASSSVADWIANNEQQVLTDSLEQLMSKPGRIMKYTLDRTLDAN